MNHLPVKKNRLHKTYGGARRYHPKEISDHHITEPQEKRFIRLASGLPVLSRKGCATKEASVGKSESYEDDVKILHRMIAYLRDEAERLRIVEVVRLMEQAEDAIEACAASSDDDDRLGFARIERELVPTEH